MQPSAPGETPPTPGRDGLDGRNVEMPEVPPFRARVDHLGEETIVVLSGELDLSSAPRLRELLAAVFTENQMRHLVLDFSDLLYLDSTGLSILVTTHKRAQTTGIELRLINLNSSVRRLFEITALDQVFMIVEDAAPPDTPAFTD